MMAGLREVPTDELLTFQDFPTAHSPTNTGNAEINIDMFEQTTKSFNDFGRGDSNDDKPTFEDTSIPINRSFWTIEYYQQFFDVDTKDVTERILASVIPKRDSNFKAQIKLRPDLYGPFWISVTLIFTIGISGNIANYLQHANMHYNWKYDFHLVSYAATTIYMYISVIPLCLWGLFKWSIQVNDLDGLEDVSPPNALELTCIYGYSLFIYIPVSILWCIQINLLQWFLVLVAAVISGSVLVFTLTPALRLSRHKLFLTIAIIGFHSLLAAGFMLFFFHVPASNITTKYVPEVAHIIANITTSPNI